MATLKPSATAKIMVTYSLTSTGTSNAFITFSVTSIFIAVERFHENNSACADGIECMETRL